jgi:NTE family protein
VPISQLITDLTMGLLQLFQCIYVQNLFTYLKHNFLVLLCGFIYLPAMAQVGPQPSTPPVARPKIGLVLSGGGAKGIAHIGVLKVLEAEGIIPDVITGTSMGSLVGGLYAMGYRAAELEEIVLNARWEELLGNSIPLDKITIEEKAYYGRFIAELPISGLKIQVPKGAIEGQKLSELFSRLTRGAHHIQDFNELPIPFACMAADITNGEPVKLSTGSLPVAMRASMAIPSIFTPVKIDGRLLVDGGLIRNFPVQEAIEMGADIVIGVNVSSGFMKEEELKSMFDLILQSSFMVSNFDTEDQKKQVSLLIEPELANYSAGSFTEAAGIIAKGEAAALQHISLIREVAAMLKTYGPLPVSPQRFPSPDTVRVSKVQVSGNEQVPDEYIKDKLRLEANNWLSLNKIEERIDVLFGTRYFEKITYEFAPSPEGTVLVVRVVEAAPAKVKVALHYDSENGGGFTMNYTARNLLLAGSRLIVEADIAERPRWNTNFLKYIGQRKNFAALVGLDFLRSDVFGFANIDNSNAIFKNNFLAYYARLQSANAQDFHYGLFLQQVHSRETPRVTTLVQIDDRNTFDIGWIDRTRYRSANTGLFFELNTLDKQFFPTKGWHLMVKATYLFGVQYQIQFLPAFDSLSSLVEPFLQNNDFVQGYMDITRIFRRSNRFSWLLKGVGVWNSRDDINLVDRYQLGGFNPITRNTLEFPGVAPFEYTLQNFALAKAMGQYRFLDNIYLQGSVNYVRAQGGDGNQPFHGRPFLWGYGLSLHYDSLIGPFTLGVGKSEGRESNLRGYLSMGFKFR